MYVQGNQVPDSYSDLIFFKTFLLLSLLIIQFTFTNKCRQEFTSVGLIFNVSFFDRPFMNIEFLNYEEI